MIPDASWCPLISTMTNTILGVYVSTSLSQPRHPFCNHPTKDKAKLKDGFLKCLHSLRSLPANTAKSAELCGAVVGQQADNQLEFEQ